MTGIEGAYQQFRVKMSATSKKIFKEFFARSRILFDNATNPLIFQQFCANSTTRPKQKRHVGPNKHMHKLRPLAGAPTADTLVFESPGYRKGIEFEALAFFIQV